MGQRISDALHRKNGGNQSEMARFIGVSPQAVQKWISGETEPRGKNLTKAAEFLGVSEVFLKFGPQAVTNVPPRSADDDFAAEAPRTRYEDVMPGGSAPRKDFSLETLEKGSGRSIRRRATDFEVVPADLAAGDVGRIEYWDAKGSCGGGFLNYENLPKGHLIKETTFFQKYGVRPENLFAIYADGNSMADFIVDGDIVIFDKTKIVPASGKIYAIEHPDGLRIKQLRRDIGGAWILESKNKEFADERIAPDEAHLLKIRGQFVYRQGG